MKIIAVIIKKPSREFLHSLGGFFLSSLHLQYAFDFDLTDFYVAFFEAVFFTTFLLVGCPFSKPKR